jgi:hypothetical protein
MTFKLPEGSIRFLMPANRRPGEQVSTRPFLIPEASTDAERAANRAKLATLSVQWRGEVRRLDAVDLEWRVPENLSRLEGELCLAEPHQCVSIDPPGATHIKYGVRGGLITTFDIPAVQNARTPLRIQGPFDGELSRVRVHSGNSELPVIAESEVEALVDANGLRGRKEVVVEMAGKAVAIRQVQFVDFQSAPVDFDPRWRPGTVKLSITGLNGLVEPLALVLYTRYHMVGRKFGIQEATLGSQSVKPAEVGLQDVSRVTSSQIHHPSRRRER